MTTGELPFTPVEKRKLTPEEFRREYMILKKPIVLTGAMEQWPASKWSIDHMGARFGDDVLPIRHFEEDSQWVAHQMSEQRLSEFLSTVMSVPWTKGGRAPLIDSSLFFQLDPELRDEIPVWSYFDNWITRLSPEFRAQHEYLSHGFVLIGPAGAVYNLHYDFWSAHACIAHFEGTKRVVLYPPDQRRSLYNGRVDVDNPDLTKFPDFKNAKGRMEVILEPGDIAFVPSRWWHQVSYLTPCLSFNSFMVNTENVDDYLGDLNVYQEMVEDPAEKLVINELIQTMRAFKESPSAT